jgi:hypothetical protein
LEDIYTEGSDAQWRLSRARRLAQEGDPGASASPTAHESRQAARDGAS